LLIAVEFMDSCKIKLHGQSEAASPFQALPVKIGSFVAAAVYNNEVFITGVGEECDEIWRYSFASGWRKCGSLLQSRHFHCAEFMDETMYIIGGCTPAEEIVLDSVEAYNVLTEKTTIVGQLKFGSKDSASVAYKDSIYIFGGTDKDEKGLDCVQVFNPVGNTCTLLSTSMPRAAELVRAVLWKTFAILLFNAGCFVFNFEENTWQEREQFTPYEEINIGLYGMVLENERIFIICGVFKETDAGGEEQINCMDEVKYIRASNVVNNEATKWQTYGKLPKQTAVIASAKLSIAS